MNESLACLTGTLVPGSQYQPQLQNTPDQLPCPPECCLIPKMTQWVRAHTAALPQVPRSDPSTSGAAWNLSSRGSDTF